MELQFNSKGQEPAKFESDLKMAIKIHRSIEVPIRKNVDFNQRWNQDDQGLIVSWEAGRELAIKAPELQEKAINDELVELPWKRGSWFYLAMWQGLRGENLDIDTSKQLVMIRHFTNTNGKPAQSKIKFPESGVDPEQLSKLKAEGRIRKLYFD